MIFDGSESRNDYTVAGRVIPLMEALSRSIRKAARRPIGEATYSTRLPQWCHKICDELNKTMFRRLVEMAPSETAFDSRNSGRVLGMLLRGAIFFYKEVPERLKREGLLDLSEEEGEKVDGIMGWESLFATASEWFQRPVSTEDELISAAKERTDKKAEESTRNWLGILGYLLNQPIKEQHEFLRGIPEGFISVLGEQGEYSGAGRRTEVFMLLLRWWPEIAAMQGADPPKTRKDLLKWLEKEEGKQLFDDERAFNDLCEDIDLNLAPPGHPRKSSPV